MRSDLRILLFCVIILLLIILSAFTAENYLRKDSQRLNRQAIRILNSIHSSSWSSAQKYGTSLEREWFDAEKIWAVFVNHHEIDNITSALIKAKVYLQYRDEKNTTAYLEELMEYLRHVPDLERLSIRNVL